jgi:hypothetical protein
LFVLFKWQEQSRALTEGGGVQVAAMQPVQIRTHPLGISKLSKINMSISPLKNCETPYCLYALRLLNRRDWKKTY